MNYMSTPMRSHTLRKSLWRLFVLSIILVILPSLVHGQDRELISKARGGDPQAQYELGLHYYKAKAYSRAVRMWEQAAKGGNPSAQNSLAMIYAKGTGVQKNLGKAVELWSQAAESGHPNAQYMMGVLYASGQGVSKDVSKAVEWWTKAADQGVADAQYRLGMVYFKGDAERPNDDEVVKRWTQAAKQGHPKAQYFLGVLYYTGAGVQEDQKKAQYWFLKAAEQGHVSGQFSAGMGYYMGAGVEKDLSKAFVWLEKAANQKNIRAMGRVGDMYEAGEGIEKNHSKAIEWWAKAAALGDENSKNKLARANTAVQASKETEISDERKRKYAEIKRIEDSYIKKNILDERYSDNCERYYTEAQLGGEKTRCLKRVNSILEDKNRELEEQIRKAEEIKQIEDNYVKNNILDQRYRDNCERYYTEAKMGGERTRCIQRRIKINSEKIQKNNERIKKAEEIKKIEDRYVKNNIFDKRYRDNCQRYYTEAQLGGETTRCLKRMQR